METPLTLSRSISPPPKRIRPQPHTVNGSSAPPDDEPGDLAHTEPTLAAIEAGKAQIRNHIEYFSKHLGMVMRLEAPGPRLEMSEWERMYRRNNISKGRHFVVHQHDHPISGVHYDLRLQFSVDSSMSFAIPYGLPGNPNSIRPNRMAIETRVHCLWNHLIESASYATGSLLIWDTGEYSILPRSMAHASNPTTDDSDASAQELSINEKHIELSDSEKLANAFQSRYIRLRLHGTKLPPGYTVTLRLPSANDMPSKRPRKRRRRTDTAKSVVPSNEPETTDSDADYVVHGVQAAKRKTSQPVLDPASLEHADADDAALASNDEEDETIRAANAYPGAHNTIGSVHQRRWFLTLDKANSGFVRSSARKWQRKDDVSGWEAFFVRGRDEERSVVTGRLAQDIMEDEGVKHYMGRKMWRPIME